MNVVKKTLLTALGFCCLFLSAPVHPDFQDETGLRQKIKASWTALRNTKKKGKRHAKKWAAYENSLKTVLYPMWFRTTGPTGTAYKVQIDATWEKLRKRSSLKKHDFQKKAYLIKIMYEKLGEISGTLDYVG